MISRIKNNPNKIFRGIVFAVVLFGLFFIADFISGINAYARSWEVSLEDAAPPGDLPPGDLYFLVPGQMPRLLTHPLLNCSGIYPGLFAAVL